jgi:demethylmenaquinone methyltransferase/2-methoxy-6-polyprenyl-1,4-benzoquinol methylase
MGARHYYGREASRLQKTRSMQTSKESGRIRAMFAGISGRYDLLNRLLSLGIDRCWRRRAVRELSIAASDRLLDACTGTADLALEMARHVDPSLGGRVLGADFCVEMVALGEAKRRRRGRSALSLLVADALALPFPAASFDGAAVAFGVRNLEDLRAGLAELGRVLRPGGRLVILEFTTPAHPLFRRLFGFYFHRLLPRLGQWLSGSPAGAEAYSYLPASVGEFPRPAELSALLAEAGFTACSHRLLSGGIAALYSARRPAAAFMARAAELAAERR